MNRMTETFRHLAMWVLLLACAAAQATESTPPLERYRAVYTASYNGMKGEAVETLSLDHAGVYHAAQDLSALVVTIRERSHFREVSEKQLRPDYYHYAMSMLFKKREQREQFDWEKGQVTHLYKDNTTTEKAPEGLLDRFSSRMQLRLDLAAGKKEMTYPVAEKGKIREYRFAVAGEEQLQTFAGNVSAVKVDRVRKEGASRQTSLWFVPAWDWLMVRMLQTEDGGEFSLELTEARIGEQTLQAVED